MDSQKLNNWLSVIANFGVLVGILILVVEIRQNSELMRVQIEQQRSDAYVAWQREIASGDHVATLFAKITALLDEVDPSEIFEHEGFSPEERERLASVALARFYDYENLFAQYQRGFISESYWQERVTEGIREWAPLWMAASPPDGPSARSEFKIEVRRILGDSD